MFKNLLLVVVSLALSLLTTDWLLGRLGLGERYILAMKQGVGYDTRSRMQVVIDYRNREANWYPMQAANHHLVQAKPLYLNGERVLPLGEVAHSHVVSCNEGGYHSTYATDEAGFRNPPNTWPLDNGKHIFLVGDSFTQGACVNDGDGLADHLRRDSLRVVNLGMAGNGPLFELAGIREYIPEGKVLSVFWLYCEENDLTDIERELQDPILRNYLVADFKQGLWARQKEINALVANDLESRVRTTMKNQSPILPHIVDALRRLRYGQPKPPHNTDTIGEQSTDLELFFKIIAKARQEVEAKGGRFVFVYLPQYARISGGKLGLTGKHRVSVLAGIRDLGIPVIDIEPVFNAHAAPISLFPLRMNGHYTPEGYRLVANALNKQLKQDGFTTHGRRNN